MKNLLLLLLAAVAVSGAVFFPKTEWSEIESLVPTPYFKTIIKADDLFNDPSFHSKVVVIALKNLKLFVQSLYARQNYLSRYVACSCPAGNVRTEVLPFLWGYKINEDTPSEMLVKTQKEGLDFSRKMAEIVKIVEVECPLSQQCLDKNNGKFMDILTGREDNYILETLWQQYLPQFYPKVFQPLYSYDIVLPFQKAFSEFLSLFSAPISYPTQPSFGYNNFGFDKPYTFGYDAKPNVFGSYLNNPSSFNTYPDVGSDKFNKLSSFNNPYNFGSEYTFGVSPLGTSYDFFGSNRFGANQGFNTGFGSTTAFPGASIFPGVNKFPGVNGFNAPSGFTGGFGGQNGFTGSFGGQNGFTGSIGSFPNGIYTSGFGPDAKHDDGTFNIGKLSGNYHTISYGGPGKPSGSVVATQFGGPNTSGGFVSQVSSSDLGSGAVSSSSSSASFASGATNLADLVSPGSLTFEKKDHFPLHPLFRRSAMNEE